MKQSNFPPHWDEDRVKDVLAHYESQSEDDAVAEYEAAFEASDQTVMGIPTELVPEVRELIARHYSPRLREKSPWRTGHGTV
jgi:O-phosphoseryl-tRNA(Cys) synthetase